LLSTKQITVAVQQLSCMQVVQSALGNAIPLAFKLHAAPPASAVSWGVLAPGVVAAGPLLPHATIKETAVNTAAKAISRKPIRGC
jgi:hypothetical protein